MLKNHRTIIITLSIITLLTAGIVSYVNYLMSQPLDIDLPKEFSYNGEKIALAWTDDNTGENLIIQSDRKEYNGFNSVDVYFSITNINRRDQDMDVVVWVENEKVKVEKIGILDTENNENKIVIPNLLVPQQAGIGDPGLNGEDENLNQQLLASKTVDNNSNSYGSPLDSRFRGNDKGDGGDIPPPYQEPAPDLLRGGGQGEVRKGINGFTTGYSVNDQIESGETNYYKATIKYPPMSKGEFFIEAFGTTKGTKFPIGNLVPSAPLAYGHLDPWYSSNWSYRKHIIIDADQVATTTSAFPVLATTTDSDLAFTSHSGKVASSTGADIVFADPAGNLLNYEREYYASTTGEIVYWVKTDISSTTDTVLYMYYGNSSMQTDLATTTGVWDDNFVMVQHLQEDPGPGGTGEIVDSTQYDNDGTATTSMTTSDQVTGQIDGSLDFDGDDDYVGVSDSASLRQSSDFSISFWAKSDIEPVTGYGYTIISKGGDIADGGGEDHNFWIDFDDNKFMTGEGIVFGFEDSAGTNYQAEHTLNIIAGTLYHITAVFDDSADTSYIYVDGSFGASTSGLTATPVTNIQPVSISRFREGTPVATLPNFDGIIDEVRISNIARTAGWIETEYNNQVSVDTFLTFGAEEDNTPTEFVSTIMQSSGDYGSLSAWENAVECDLTATTTRVFSGTITGTLDQGDILELFRGGVYQNITASTTATTSSQILVNNVSGIYDDGLVLQTGDQWRLASGTTNMWTVSGSGADLGDSPIAIAQIDGAWTIADETAVLINGWTTSASNYIKIYTTTAARHNGTWSGNANAYHLDVDVNWDSALQISESYTKIIGLAVRLLNDSVGTNYGAIEANASNITVEKSIVVRHPSSTDGVYGIWVRNVPSYVSNIIAYNCSVGFYSTYGDNNQYVYNSTAVDCTRGFETGYSDIVAKNCLTVGSATYGFGGSTFGSGSTHNASTNNDAPGANPVDLSSYVGTDIFIDYDNDDFHLASTDTAAKNAGTNLFGDSNLSFSDDIDGDTRPASNWDIGADEAETAVEFVSTIMQTGGEYSRLYDWEDAIECDLTASTTRVYSITATTSMIADATAVTTDSGASTATLIHQASSSQILLINISGSFDSGDYVTDGTNSVILSDNGAPAIAVAKIDGAWTSADTQGVDITGWTTGTSTYIKIYTTEAARHNGKWDEGKYRLDGASVNGIIDVDEAYIRIEGLQVANDRPVGNTPGGIWFHEPTESGEVHVSHNIIQYDGTENLGWIDAGLNINTGSYNKIKIWNNIVYNWGYGIFFSYNVSANEVIVYNNTSVDNVVWGFHLRNGGNLYLKNNISNNNGGSYYIDSNWDSKTTSNNISEDDTSPDSGYQNRAVTFFDETNDDFHLAASDTAAKDAGTDLSADSNLNFTDDIDGEERPAGVNWDIGADEKKRATVINSPLTNKWTDGLVGYWTFNGEDMDWASTTAEALDRSGNSNNGNVVNGAKAAIGKVGQGMEFDGVNDYIYMDNHISSIALTSEGAIVAWIKSSADPADGEQIIMSASDAGDAESDVSFSLTATNGYLRFLVREAGSIFFLADIEIDYTDGEWRHMVATIDSSGNKFYVDGIQKTPNYISGSSSDTEFFDDVNDLDAWRIGVRRTSNTNERFFNGLMDEVRIYNRALSAEEIAEQYRAGARKLQANSPITNKLTDGLVGHWTFNGEDMDGTTAYDRSGQGNNGTLTNGPKPAIGKVGQGMEFDGVDDIISVSENNSLNIADSITIVSWVKFNILYSDSNIRGIVSKEPGAVNDVYSLDYEGSSGKGLRFIGRDVSNNVIFDLKYDKTNLAIDTWYHLGATFSKADTNAFFYLNGNEIVSDTSTLDASIRTDIGEGLSIGRYVKTADTFNGTMDEVRIYNQALSASEIGELYRAGARKMGL